MSASKSLLYKINILPIELIRIIKEYALDAETHLDYMINRHRYYYNNMLIILENMSYQKLRTCYRMSIHPSLFQDNSNSFEPFDYKKTIVQDFYELLPKTVYMLSRTHMSEQAHPFYSYIHDLEYKYNEMATEGQNRRCLARSISQLFRVLESGNTFHEKMNRRMREIALGIFRGFILLRRIS